MKFALWAVAVFGIIVAAGLALEDRPAAAPSSAASPQRALSRDQFLDGCRVDRQIEACVQAVGQPDRRQSGDAGGEAWYYSARTFDSVTKKTDALAQVIVQHGVVRRVNFH